MEKAIVVAKEAHKNDSNTIILTIVSYAFFGNYRSLCVVFFRTDTHVHTHAQRCAHAWTYTS